MNKPFRLTSLIILLLLTCPFISSAQDFITISGKIVDSETNEPLAYSTISIKNASIGVISNLNGQFKFSVPQAHHKASVMVSMLGYETLLLAVGELNANPIFKLKQEVVQLEEVTITTKKQTGNEILKEAIKRQKEHAPQSDYALGLFVRELFYFDSTCYAVVESAAELFGRAFPKPDFDVYLDHSRSAVGSEPTQPIGLFKDYNPFGEFQRIVGSKKRMMYACKECPYEIEKYTFWDDRLVAVIASKRKDSSSRYFRYTIDMENYAILKFDFGSRIPMGSAFKQDFGDIRSSLVYLERTIEFQEFEGQYFLKSYRQIVKHGYEKEEGVLAYTTLHVFQVLANSIETSEVQPLKSSKHNGKLMNYKKTLFSQSDEGNSEFWNQYNGIERTSEEDELFMFLSQKH